MFDSENNRKLTEKLIECSVAFPKNTMKGFGKESRNRELI
jgi:hypothetical protein